MLFGNDEGKRKNDPSRAQKERPVVGGTLCDGVEDKRARDSQGDPDGNIGGRREEGEGSHEAGDKHGQHKGHKEKVAPNLPPRELKRFQSRVVADGEERGEEERVSDAHKPSDEEHVSDRIRLARHQTPPLVGHLVEAVEDGARKGKHAAQHRVGRVRRRVRVSLGLVLRRNLGRQRDHGRRSDGQERGHKLDQRRPLLEKDDGKEDHKRSRRVVDRCRSSDRRERQRHKPKQIRDHVGQREPRTLCQQRLPPQAPCVAKLVKRGPHMPRPVDWVRIRLPRSLVHNQPPPNRDKDDGPDVAKPHNKHILGVRMRPRLDPTRHHRARKPRHNRTKQSRKSHNPRAHRHRLLGLLLHLVHYRRVQPPPQRSRILSVPTLHSVHHVPRPSSNRP